MTSDTAAAAQRQAARIAGLAYVFGILYVPVFVLADVRLIAVGDPAATIANIQANQALFRVGIASTVAMLLSVFVLIVALYVTLERVNRNLALLGLILRIPESMLGLVTVLISLRLSQLASSEAPSGFAPEQVQTLVQLALHERFDASTLVLVFLGLGSLPFLYLFFTARYAPRPLVGFGMLAYVVAVVSAFVSILWPGSAAAGMQTYLVAPVAAFELVFGLWLAIRSVDVPEPERASRSTDLPATSAGTADHAARTPA
jgi:hypothetical protein